MSKPWKPRDYSSVSPYLIVSRADAVIDFLRDAFGAVPLRRIDRPDGSLMHGEMRIDDSVVMLGEPEADAPWGPTPAHVHVYVPDVDVAFRRAVATGAEVVQEPRGEDEPDRRGAVRGPGGHTWWIATQVSPDD
jgi:uncharacterized glyoxalase superfamily protein PhnB